MYTIMDVRQELIDHLYKVDKSKLSAVDLKIYADTVQIVNDMEDKAKGDTITAMLSSLAVGPRYKTVDMKEEM